MPCWYYDNEALHKTPSIQDGIDYKTECRYRKEGARFIIDIGSEMDLGYNTSATGVVFFHRFYMFHSFKTFSRYVTACCCLFLAGKVEETPKKCKDIIKIAKKLLSEDRFLAFGDDPKEEVMTLERILLQTIKFDLKVQHPYSYLIRYAKGLQGDENKLQKMVQMAWTFINDSLCTTLSIQWEPEIIAIAVMYLAGKLSKFKVVGWSHRRPYHIKWWDVFVQDLKMDVLEDICHQVLDLYSPLNNDKLPPDSPPTTQSTPAAISDSQTKPTVVIDCQSKPVDSATNLISALSPRDPRLESSAVLSKERLQVNAPKTPKAITSWTPMSSSSSVQSPGNAIYSPSFPMPNIFVPSSHFNPTTQPGTKEDINSNNDSSTTNRGFDNLSKDPTTMILPNVYQSNNQTEFQRSYPQNLNAKLQKKVPVEQHDNNFQETYWKNSNNNFSNEMCSDNSNDFPRDIYAEYLNNFQGNVYKKNFKKFQGDFAENLSNFQGDIRLENSNNFQRDAYSENSNNFQRNAPQRFRNSRRFYRTSQR